MAYDIKTKLLLEGEKQYTQAMKNASSAVREMNSRLKVAQTEFAKTGDQQKYVSDQTEILKEKIAEQEKAVRAAEEALKFLAENGLEETDEKMRKWRISMNNAQANLNRLEKELDDVSQSLNDNTDDINKQEKAFDSAEKEADDYKKTLDNIDKNVSFSTMLDKLGLVKNTITGVYNGLKNIGKEIWDFESQSAQWADEINTAASQAGVDAATYQSWRYASRFIDVSVEDLVSLQKKITEVMANGSEESMMIFNKLGVPTRNADGTLRNSYDVMLDVADALGKIANETSRSAIASKLLGEEYNKLNPLIDAGSAAWNEYLEEAKDVATVSENSLNALQKLDDSRQKLNAQTEAIKMEVAGKLAPGFTAITDGLSTALDSFSDFLQTDKGQDLIGKINGLLNDFGEKIADVDLGAAIEKFVNGLSWIIENSGSIIEKIGMIATTFGTIKIADSVLKFMNQISGGKATMGASKINPALFAVARNSSSSYVSGLDFNYLFEDKLEKPLPEGARVDNVEDLFPKSNELYDPFWMKRTKIFFDARIDDDYVEMIDTLKDALNKAQIDAYSGGEDLTAAYAQGIDSNIYLVTQAAARVAAAARITSSAASFGGMLTANIVMSGQQVGEIVSPVVDGYIGSEIEGR